MLILEKIRKKYHQICITIDGENVIQNLIADYKGKSKLFFIRTNLAPPFIGDDG
jgi:hypothetical protein